jgi:N-methylhydantoinase A
VTPDKIAALFGEEHQRIYGFRAPSEEPVELIGLSGIARGLPERPRLPERIPPVAANAPSMRRAWFPASGWIDARVVDRASLSETPGSGPFIVQEYDATCLVPHGTHARVDAFGNIELTVSAGS